MPESNAGLDADLFEEPDDLEAGAAVLFTLGQLHRASPSQATLDAFVELSQEWPIPVGEHTARALELFALSRSQGETPEQIKTDHNWLYGVSATAKVAPYESVHRGRDHLIFDDDTLRVRAAYKDMGFSVLQYNKIPDDHVGIEMEFLARCLLQALDAKEKGDLQGVERYLASAKSFLNDHVLQWAPTMLNQAADKAETAFMEAVALASIDAIAFAEQISGSSAQA